MAVNLTQGSGGGADDTSGNAGGGNPENVGGSNGGGAGNQGNGSPDNGGNTEQWYSGLKDQENQNYAKSKGWADQDASIKSYRELEKKLSERTEAPTPPKSADEYKFNVPTDLPKEAAYNSDFAKWFRDTSFKLKVPADLAAQYHDEFVGYAKTMAEGGMKSATEALTKTVETAQRNLEGKWGQLESPGFKRNVDLAQRAMRMLNLDPEAMGITRGGTVVNAEALMAMAKVGQGMYAEDTLYGTPDKGVNPFDPKTENLTLQGRMIKENREQAKLMIEAAGRRKDFPSLYK